eukprot:5625685-Amphidinium_carterae.1
MISCISYCKFCLIASGLLTGFGLELMAGMLAGPSVDSATLQLVGTLVASTLLPGLAWAFCCGGTAKKNKESPDNI